MQGKKSLILSLITFPIIFVSLPMSYPTLRAGTQSALAQYRTAQVNTQVKPPEGKGSVDSLPQIKWNMSTEQISQRVDQMTAAVNQSNPLSQVNQTAFTRALSYVRDTVVKNDMAAYQKAVTALAEVTSKFTVKERNKLDEVLRQINAEGSTCSITCGGNFASCSIACPPFAIASCGCFSWGFPVCGCKYPPRDAIEPREK